MAEENQQQVQQVEQEPQRVTTKNPKKVEAGKRLTVHNHRKRKDLKAKKREEQVQAQKSGTSGANIIN